MRDIRCSFAFFIAVMGGLLLDSSPARGSSMGYHEYLKHQHSSALVLPPLYEPQPKHVPVLTNAQLIRLWETNQFSPILRNPKIEMQLCAAVTERRDLNPQRFDFYHPLIGRLLSNPSFFEYAVHLYDTHTARFVHYHHHYIPLIRGCAMMMMANQAPQTISPPPGSTTSPGIPGSENSSPPGQPTQNGSPPPQPTVPAPPSIILMVIGMGYLTARRARGRHDG